MHLSSRGAFSHVPMWRVISKVAPALVGQGGECFDAIFRPYALVGDTSSSVDRPHAWALDLRSGAASAVFCNDMPSSFGAPDVLAVGVDNLKGELVAAEWLEGTPPFSSPGGHLVMFIWLAAIGWMCWVVCVTASSSNEKQPVKQSIAVVMLT